MKKIALTVAATVLSMFAIADARAEEKLIIFSWGDYTAPDLIAKFEKETGIKVTIDTFDANETMLAKLKQGATGYDIVVPSHNFVPIMIKEGLLQKINAKDLKGYENIEDRWKSPEWDPDNQYTIPWQWGTTSFMVDTNVYKGDIDTLKLLFDPPKELQGSIGMFRTPDEVIAMAQIYAGVPLCNENVEDMKKVQAVLEKQKPFVKVYSSDGILERLVSGDTAMHMNWSGYSLRSRAQRLSLRYSYPKEGVLTFMDSLAVPVDAPHYQNALRFLSFYLQPENAAIESNFANYANGIVGSSQFYTEELRGAPEMNPPDDMKPIVTKTCSEKAIKLADKVWTKLLQ
jgi:spermidine/putrescine transport system substrate-binding protein